MKFILTPKQMNAVDHFAIKKLRIPSMRLMEKAGTVVAKEIVKILDSLSRPDTYRPTVRWKDVQRQVESSDELKKRNVIIFCGKGNNGGDGFVTARRLAEKHINVVVVLIEKENTLSGEPLHCYDRLNDDRDIPLDILNYRAFQQRKNKKFDVIVDAMLGTSFHGTLKGKYLQVVRWCNRQTAAKVSVDIPTGLNGENGEVHSDAFHADVTVTMSNPKSGFFYGRAKEFTGRVIIAEIGIPKNAVRKIVSNRGNTARTKIGRHGRDSSKTTREVLISLIEMRDIQKSFPDRATNSHKHSVGKVFVLAGSKSMMGASLLCSQSAMKSGAGQVILGVPDSEYSIIAKRTQEIMPIGLYSTRDGSTAPSAIEEIMKRVAWANVVLIGCGMSRNEETQSLIRDVIRSCKKPLVIDADGLNALVGNLDWILERKTNSTILTPHRGEFSRLMGLPSPEIESNKFSFAANFAKKYHITLVLKGAPTIVADPKGRIFVNSTGNPGMSTAGSGDVLAGMIASFIGQGNSLVDAAVNGVYIHGMSGDAAAQKIGMHGMTATDMIAHIPSMIKKTVGR